MSATTVVAPPPDTIPCSTATANGGLPLCTENNPNAFNGVPVVSSNNISPPSDLVNFIKLPELAPVDNSQPDPELGPATLLP